MSSTEAVMITATALSKEYRSVPALDALSFRFEEGEIIGIIGHNGAGKTTLLKLMAGLILPTAGTLCLHGIDVARHPDQIKELIGYLPEESRLYETMTAEDYLAFFGEIYGLPRKEITARRERLFASLSLQTDGKKLSEFSKGMKRKVAIARSLLHDPAILIYDEPTSGLDPMTSRFILDYVRSLRERGKTVILSAHNLSQVEAICDRVMILRRGTIVAMGSMTELRAMFGTVSYSIYYSGTGDGSIPGLPEHVREGGLFRVRAGSIEEMNAITSTIASGGGIVERIESHFPSLEEMLVMIGR